MFSDSPVGTKLLAKSAYTIHGRSYNFLELQNVILSPYVGN